MILDISDEEFKDIFGDAQFHLPIRWDGVDFAETLRKLFNRYLNQLERYQTHNKQGNAFNHIDADYHMINEVCWLLLNSVKHYLNGFPSRAFQSLSDAMDILMNQPLKVYYKSVLEQFDKFEEGKHQDRLQLFRIARVYDNCPYPRSRIFHTPYNLRSKVSTNRYSIAGYPSLYLATSLELCCNELNIVPSDLAIASRFMFEREIEYSNTEIRVIELGLKPQDFIDEQEKSINRDNYHARRVIPHDFLQERRVRSAYLLWYPLIAACSYIRVNKADPFAAEYIIPQLLMQWVRIKGESSPHTDYDQLMGIRYFSCASVKASDMGFNYVFPTSGQPLPTGLPFCSVLSHSFRLTKPVFIHEFPNIYECERFLHTDTDLNSVNV